MKKFRDWLFNRTEEVEYVLFPPLVTEEMLPKRRYILRNGEEAELRIGTVEHLDDIIAIQEACYGGEAPWGRMAVNNELRNKRGSFFLMVYHEDEAFAFIGMSTRQDSLHVTNIATHPDYQKNGIATFLLQTVAEIAPQLERHKITLEVRMSNEGAKRLYRKLGFLDGRIKRNYYHNNGEDALDMFYLIEETGGLDDPQCIQ